jgi:signal transduction histidine kinase
VLQTGRPAKVEDYEDLPGAIAAGARESGLNRTAGAPIIVAGSIWGVMGIASPDGPLPPHAESRLAQFTELVGTAIANGQARDELTRLAEEQAALRRVATLVAAGAQPTEVFDAVTAEVAALIPTDGAALARFEADRTITVVSEHGYSTVGRHFPLEGSLSGVIFETGRPARVEDYAEAPGRLGEAARELGWRSSVGAPVSVDGRPWGALVVSSRSEQPLPRDTEQRLAKFTELVATAIANSEAQEELARLADEQATLRRVATLAAKGAQPVQVFGAVSEEVAGLFRADAGGVMRYEADGTLIAVGGWTAREGHAPTGMRFTLEGSVSGLILETGRPARIDSFADMPGETAAAMRDMGWQTAAGAPISVEGRLWGTLVVYSLSAEPFAFGTEERLAKFGEIVATAIANTESREEITRLADEQAALRRVATLVAQGVRPLEIFAAVSDEVSRLFGAEQAAIGRFEPDGSALVVVGASGGVQGVSVGGRWPNEDFLATTAVYRTGRTARTDQRDLEGASGPVAERLREIGFISTVSAPIIVEGTLWGVMILSDRRKRLPPDTEERVENFTELVATAIANAESRAELEASRSRIVATADATRRRIERDLHDGAQQRLLSLALELRAAQTAVPAEMTTHRAELSHVAEGLTDVLDGLREIALGLHPAILAEGGLGPALKTLAQRSPIPVMLDCQAEGRLAEHLEVAAYYIVSEALTNAAKHARASKVDVGVVVRDRVLSVAVADDGVGGADPARGSGLLGLKDRAAAIGGTLRLESGRGKGTSLVAELPLGTSSP